MIVLGINAYHGDASAAILVDGRLVAAAEEERFTRVKHAAGFPAHAVRYCLAAAGAGLADVHHVAIPRDPRARWWRKAWYAARLPRFARDRIRAAGRVGRIADALARAVDADPRALRARVHRVEHHRAHLASAFFVSPFDRAAVLSLDGLGDFASGMWGVGEGGRLRVAGSVAFPHSVGLWYTAVTQLLGFPHYGDEYKVMGLAAHGAPSHLAAMERMLRTREAPGYQLDLACFTHHRDGPSMTWETGAPVLGSLFAPELARRLGPPREAGAALEPRHRDVAASLQARLDDVVAHHFAAVTRVAGTRDLAYAGGVAFNCVANGHALARGHAGRLFVQPAAGDGGLSVGAACYVWHHVLGRPREFVMQHVAWGPEPGEAQAEDALRAAGLRPRRLEPAGLVEEVARRLADGQVVGWFQGRAEFGPRALGQRSILADPRHPGMPDRINQRIKRRETFRPFAPSVLAERATEWFDLTAPSPFMLIAAPVRASRRALVPAVTHVDGSARPQTVERRVLPRFAELIEAFERRTGVPMVLNTSFNDNEPIVHAPDDAVRCFARGELDALAIGPFLVARDGGS